MTHSSDEVRQPTGKVLQVIYDLFRQRGAWPTFRAVDLRFDRLLGIEDAQAALAAVLPAFLQRAWRAHGFYDTDEVRLSLRGVRACDGGPADLQLLADFMCWLTDTEQSQDQEDESDLVVTSTEFAEVVGLRVEAEPEGEVADARAAGTDGESLGTAPEPVDPLGAADVADEEVMAEHPENTPTADAEVEENRATLVRLRLLADLLPRFWGGGGYQEPWRWQYTIDRQRLRPYRRIRGVEQLLDYADQQRQDLEQRQDALVRAASVGHGVEFPTPEVPWVDAGSQTEGELPQPGDEIDILLTLLRSEIVEAAGAQLRGRLYDDAIFAAYRRVESVVQERARLPGTIGDQLVKQAFEEISDPIRISARSQDSQRMIQLLSGALGLLKGDRSHKDRPALPCRSMRECLRQLAHASALLDLLDRDIAVAPCLHGFDHRGETLELWVDRTSAQAQVWIDDYPCEVVSHRPGCIALNVAGIPSGEHDLFIVDGTRTSPVTQIWLAPDPPRKGWYRVSEVNIPLFSDAEATQRLDVNGLRLAVLEDGLQSERVVATSSSYRVGDYVDWHWNVSPSVGGQAAQGALGPTWIRVRPGVPARQLWDASALFDGEPVAPGHEPRLMNVSLEPETLLLRLADKAPLRALGHYTDGVATWTDPVEGQQVTVSDPRIAYAKPGVVIAKGYGNATLRVECDGRYGSATIHVAAHSEGTLADVLTGLPPVAGIAWAKDVLIVSTRSSELWKLALDGTYQIAAGISLQPPTYGGTDTIAASDKGDLAARLYGHRDILVLDAASSYRKSRWVTPHDPGTVMAMTWDGDDLILAVHTGVIQRIHPDGSADTVTKLAQEPVSITHTGDAFLALTGAYPSKLWRIPLDQPDQAKDLLDTQEPASINAVAWIGGYPYFTDFHGGRLLFLKGSQILEVAAGMQNPAEMAVAPDGTIYIAEFGRGAVRRLFPQ